MTREGFELIKRNEGLRLEAYRCPAGVWTIGYGHTKGVYKGMRISKEEAEMFLCQDVEIVDNQSGAPVVTRSPFVGRVHASVSHTATLVMTEIILESEHEK